MISMERVKHKSIFWLCPLRHLLGLVGAVLIVLHRLLRGNTALMRSLSARFVRPTLQRMGQRSAMREAIAAPKLGGRSCTFASPCGSSTAW